MIQPNIGKDSIDRWHYQWWLSFFLFPLSPSRLFGNDMRRFGKSEKKSITILQNPLWNSTNSNSNSSWNHFFEWFVRMSAGPLRLPMRRHSKVFFAIKQQNPRYFFPQCHLNRILASLFCAKYRIWTLRHNPIWNTKWNDTMNEHGHVLVQIVEINESHRCSIQLPYQLVNFLRLFAWIKLSNCDKHRRADER